MQPIMRTASPTRRNLLEYYLAHEFKDEDTLVIDRTSDCSIEEYEGLIDELKTFGFAYPSHPNIDGYTIITARRSIAQRIIRNHDKGSFPMYCYCGSVCMDENH